ncbi:STAS domain-containing protein [Streptomyces fulvoviolaceus]|uniref:STAS domain-containing protein n=1 Tax=Streptomyces fulvoviolaceus TaxID=285535 RepID=UPI0004CA2C36|nr:STAS domain-containing protein [Streptomyces fulvoviolaceus]MCT9083710.1 STAS domain-containing protein [Streptomyces fulvoviolaceus]
MSVRDQASSGAAEAVPALRVFPLTERNGLRVAGEVVLPTHLIWERALERAVREDEAVYFLELSALTFVDVVGTGALAAAAQQLDDGRRLVLHRPPPALSRVLDMFWPDLSAIEVSMS